MSVIYFDRNYNLCERTGEEGSYVCTPLKQYQIRNAGFPEIRDGVPWTDSAPFFCKIIGIERGEVVYHYPEWSSGVDYKVGDIVLTHYTFGNSIYYSRCRQNHRSNSFNKPTRLADNTYWHYLYEEEDPEHSGRYDPRDYHMDFKIVCHFSTDEDWQSNFSKDNIVVLTADYNGAWYNKAIRDYLESYRAS